MMTDLMAEQTDLMELAKLQRDARKDEIEKRRTAFMKAQADKHNMLIYGAAFFHFLFSYFQGSKGNEIFNII